MLALLGLVAFGLLCFAGELRNRFSTPIGSLPDLEAHVAFRGSNFPSNGYARDAHEQSTRF
jgi:hypothetical protein